MAHLFFLCFNHKYIFGFNNILLYLWRKLAKTMTIILQILLGLLLLIAFVVGFVLVAYLFIVAYHEWTWRTKIDENYDEREKENIERQR